MEQEVTISDLGSITGRLTTDHAASSYGQPVLVLDGEAYGPGDVYEPAYAGLATAITRPTLADIEISPTEGGGARMVEIGDDDRRTIEAAGWWVG